MIGQGNGLQRAAAPGAGLDAESVAGGMETGWAGSTEPQHGLAAPAPAARLQQNIHLGVLVWNHNSSVSTVKQGGSWTRNILRMLRSKLCSEGLTGKASMLLRSQWFQNENKPCMSKEGITCFEPPRIHPPEWGKALPACPSQSLGQERQPWSTRTTETPGTGARSEHSGFILPAQSPPCVPTTAKQQ